MSTIVVLAGGEEPRPLPTLPSPDTVIAADSGLGLAEPLGLTVDLVIGDMDSVDLELLESAADSGSTLERHPADKDATDLELALDAALAREADRIVVVGGGGGRLDHLLANAALLADERYSRSTVDWFVDDYFVTVVRGSRSIAGAVGDLITLLAVDGGATVTTVGVRWPLDSERLEPGSTRGVSNQLIAREATVDVTSGTVLVLQRRAA